jgi:branched-chain amino acid aminotransferase
MNMTAFDDHISYEDFCTVITELLDANNATEDVIVRPTYFIDECMKGTKMTGLKCSLSVFIMPFGDYFDKENLRVCTSTWTRISDLAIPARAKINGSYVNACLMKNEALLNGFDDCIALDNQGFVTEGAVANVFCVKAGKLITPGIESDILEGITRDTVIQLANEIGIPVAIRQIARSEMYAMDEIFFCGSSARIWAIKSVDHRQIGAATTVTIQMQIEYAKLQSGNHRLSPLYLTKI